MGALSFGLIAAVAWGVHDILIRYVSHNLGILQSLLSVLIFGAAAQFGLFLIAGDASNISSDAFWLSVAAGGAFCIGCIGHYHAFARGPVRLVAPLIGCYSVLSFLIAVVLGTSITPLQWAALASLIIGIAFVSRSSTDVDKQPIGLAPTLGYCAMAMVGFATTFALGHGASATSDPIGAGLITRLVTIALVALIFFVVRQTQEMTFVGWTPKSFAIVALMGSLDALALGIVLAAGIFARPEFASAASSIFGLVTVILAWIFLREKINAMQWMGILLVFAAIAYLASA